MKEKYYHALRDTLGLCIVVLIVFGSYLIAAQTPFSEEHQAEKDVLEHLSKIIPFVMILFTLPLTIIWYLSGRIIKTKHREKNE